MPLRKSLSATRPSLALGIVILAALTLLSGAIHGRMSNRWGQSPALATAAENLRDLPEQFGNWRLQSSEEMSQDVLDMLEEPGYVVREYANQETAENVKIALLVGRSGPISVHTPDICFSSRDYSILDERKRVAISSAAGPDHEFWAMTFQGKNLDAGMLRVYYAWTPGRHWTAPDDPRFKFADTRYLYKIQLASSVAPGADLETNDPCRNFLKDFLPAAQRHVAGANDN
ncbi:MAG: exosortase-associated EpsI family protein [Planctomycetota bacterium]